MKNDTQKGNGVVGLIIIIAIIWGISSLFSSDKSETETYTPNTYNSASVYSSYGNGEDSQYYEEPENPYDEGSGHSAGYEWAEENDVDSCDGNSNSFIEGCEEYLSQQEESEY